MAKIALDTSIYIPLLRQGKMPGTLLETPYSTLYLSVIVAQELLAGAGDLKTTRALEDLCSSFEKHERLIVPSGEDWFSCGSVLSQIGRKHGFESIKKGRLVNDILIAIGCGHAGATLLTANHKDFQLIYSFVSFRFIAVA